MVETTAALRANERAVSKVETKECLSAGQKEVMMAVEKAEMTVGLTAVSKDWSKVEKMVAEMV